jgi:hypothetical protein
MNSQACVADATLKWSVCVLLRLLQGAFYVLPDMSSFFGPGVEMESFGPVPDCDALAMYLIKVGLGCVREGHVSGGGG